MLNLKRNSAEPAKLALERSPAPGLDELTDSEVRLLRDLTLDQAQNAASPQDQEILGALWWQMERESQRRTASVRALDRLYFGN